MGIHVEVYKKRVKRGPYYTFLRNLTRDLTHLLIKEDCIGSEKLRVSLLALRDADLDKETWCHPSDVTKIINEMGPRFNHSDISFQVAGMLKLSNPETGNSILANFEIFLPGNNYMREDFGDLMFDIGGASEEFPGETAFGFDAFFSPGANNSRNRVFLEKILKLLRQRNYPSRQIQRINVGEHAMPFARLQSCIYIYRPTYEVFQEDLIKCYTLIRKDALDETLLLSPDAKTKFRDRWDRSKDYLAIFEHPFLQEQLRLLNQENKLITEYFNNVAVAEEGSFILHSKESESYRPLYPVLESFHQKLTESIKKALPFPPKDFWKQIASNWQ